MYKPKLIVLDRDGIINYDSKHYIKNPDEWLPIDGSRDAIRIMKDLGLTVVIATNQSGVARGLYTEDTLHRIHEKLEAHLAEVGTAIDRIFYCPHHPDEKCACRKPEPGMLLAACELFEVEPRYALMIGDRESDREAAENAGMSFIRVHDTLDEIEGRQYRSLIQLVNALFVE